MGKQPGVRNAFFRQETGKDALDLFFKDLQRFPPLSREEEIKVAKAARDGDADAREMLINHNLRFSVAIAKKFQNHGVELADLVALSYKGIVRAADTFEPDRGVKFISYAVWWVRQSILEGLAKQARPVRMPLNQNTIINQYQKRIAHISNEQNIPYEEAARAYIATQAKEGTPVDEAIIPYIVQGTRPISADDHFSDSKSSVAERLMHSQGLIANDALEEEIAQRDLETVIARSLNDEASSLQRGGVSPRQARILRLYHGLEGEAPHTLEEIGSMLGVTRERVRQLRDQAYERLKKSPTFTKLHQEYLGSE